MTIEEHFDFIDWITAEMNRALVHQRDYFSAGLDAMTVDYLQSCVFLLQHEIRQLRLMVRDLESMATVNQPGTNGCLYRT